MASVRRIAMMTCAFAALTGVARAQIRTPIATVAATPGPAPTNVKAVPTSPTSVAISWDLAAGARYLVERRQTDNPTCCVAQSGYVTSGSWQDGGLSAGNQYSFVVSVLYSDGRSGSTEVMATTSFMDSLSVGALAYTACTQRKSAGPDPGVIKTASLASPAGGSLDWSSPSPAGTNYVVDRAPYGTTTWTFVGSTCGGPSPITVGQADPSTGKSSVRMRDYAGGVIANRKYTYRVTRIGPSSEVGWQTVTWYSGCMKPPSPTATVSGSTVTVTWSTNASDCGFYGSSLPPETYTLTSSFGYVKTAAAPDGIHSGFTKDVIYGVPLGTHTFSLVAGWRPDAFSVPVSTTATVAY